MADLMFVKDYIESTWVIFLNHLKFLGIPKDECESYANELLKDLGK